MRLKVLGSSSKGNCYILQGEKETLLVECGVSFKAIKEGLNFDLSKVVGCLVTHEHKDHCKAVERVVGAGVDVLMSQGTAETLGVMSHRVCIVETLRWYSRGEFSVFPFKTKHDSKEPFGFVIHHPEMGHLLFATDTYYIGFTFKGLNHIMIECNYSKDILDERLEREEIHPRVRDRIIKSHFELQDVKSFLEASHMNDVRNIVLLHLSNDNADSGRFKNEISNLTGKSTHIAEKGLEVDLSLYPF